jgi:hypothetical protein
MTFKRLSSSNTSLERNYTDGSVPLYCGNIFFREFKLYRDLKAEKISKEEVHC